MVRLMSQMTEWVLGDLTLEVKWENVQYEFLGHLYWDRVSPLFSQKKLEKKISLFSQKSYNKDQDSNFLGFWVFFQSPGIFI